MNLLGVVMKRKTFILSIAGASIGIFVAALLYREDRRAAHINAFLEQMCVNSTLNKDLPDAMAYLASLKDCKAQRESGWALALLSSQNLETELATECVRGAAASSSGGASVGMAYSSLSQRLFG